jgi:carbon monoxide dehydrogenase subunit G
MKFKSKEDLDVPIAQVFDMIADFERHERSAMRRGVKIKRLDSLEAPGLGAKWDIGFQMRGRERQAEVEVTGFDRPNEMTFEAQIQGLDSTVEVVLVPLSKPRTRLNVVGTLKPKTLSARLMVQSLKLAKKNISKRFNKKLAGLARDMEDRASKAA